MSAIHTLSISGFRSIRKLENLRLSNLNVLIGANGSGKSNFVAYFRMLSELVEGRLQVWVAKQGGADRVLTYGIKETDKLTTSIRFGINGYDLELEPTVNDGLTFTSEKLYFDGPIYGLSRPHLGSGHSEARLTIAKDKGPSANVATYCYSSIASWKFYHFHDTSDTAGVKRQCSVHDNSYLRMDASNLAAFLLRLHSEEPAAYSQIRKTVRLAIPFFDDFVLKPTTLASEEQQVRLLWKQLDSDYALWPSQLSDGSLRFICLVTALLQPNPPTTIIIDEPELGLHPYAITLLGALIRSAATKTQVIVSTQSVALLNEFELDDLIIVDRENGGSVFKQLDEEDFTAWLEDYTVGELWQKNILGGRPSR
ncbi:AAA family ATPase [Thiopseudomonas alkaliphila]|uniref:AAA family ATPase n=1 Tax=Thiopseudomonas alkaliphila TaxID=1697053 RepID=A0AAW7DQ42_9GAMM|nr:AAA family ATPase [Thiopseudomonas alkaliphila]MDM1695919.1 AAA family ATPase [Thiopseudomonas alkaliphila]